MSAVNILLRGDRAVIMTDTLIYNYLDAAPIGFYEKCFPVEGMSLAVASRGDYRLAEALAKALPMYYAGIDQIIADEAQAVCDLYDDLLAQSSLVVVSYAEFHIVGWSDEQRGVVGLVAIFRDRWSITRIDQDDLQAAPFPDDQEMANLESDGAFISGHRLERFDPETHGVMLMEAQRRMVTTIDGRVYPGHVIGGHVLLTEVNQSGVTQRIIHRWPDIEGEPIVAEPFVRKGPRVAMRVA